MAGRSCRSPRSSASPKSCRTEAAQLLRRDRNHLAGGDHASGADGRAKKLVGLAVSCGDILVMDADGVEAPHGEPGEIYIGGAMVAPGYFNDTEATEREFVAEYWKSGDLGIMDEKGYLRVIDRIKDVINRGGFKIYASEVENVLLEHPAVVEVAVVAKPCPVLGERVHAFVVLRHAVEEAELQRHCAMFSRLQGPGDGPAHRRRAAAQRQWQGSQAELAQFLWLEGRRPRDGPLREIRLRDAVVANPGMERHCDR